MTARDAYLRKLKQQLDQWNVDIPSLRVTAVRWDPGSVILKPFRPGGADRSRAPARRWRGHPWVLAAGLACAFHLIGRGWYGYGLRHLQ
jgi:hypothetical protein